MAESHTLRILFVEDVAADVELAAWELGKEGIACESLRVQTAETLVQALRDFQPDLVISDYAMPQFTGLEALRICQDQAPQTPVIIFTGSIDEETAVACMKAGASDYVLKQQIGRLPFAVREALQRKKERAEQAVTLAALRESEIQYDDLFSSMVEGFALHEIICDERGQAVDYRFLKVNPSFERLTGLRAADLVGKTALQVLPNLEPYWIETYGRVALTGKATSFENYSRELGRHYQVIAYSPRPGQFATIFEDVSERKRMEEALRESEARFRGAFEASSIGMGLNALDGSWLRVNRALCQIVGYSEQELLAMSFREITYADDLEVDLAYMQRLLAGEIASYQIEKRYKHKDGRLIPVLLSVSLVRDAADRPLYLVAQVQDISERKQAEQARRQRLAELEAIHTVTAALRHATTLHVGLSILLDETLAALDTDAGAVSLYHAVDDELRAAAARGWFRRISELPMRPGEGIGGAVFASGRSHISAEFASDAVTRAATRAQIPPGWGGVCAPIRAGATAVGVIYVARPLARPLAAEQVRLVESLAEMAGAALHRMRLHEQTMRQRDELAVVAEVALAGAAGHVFDEAVARATAALHRLWPEETLGFLFLDESDQTLRPHPSFHGLSADMIATLRIPLHRGLTGRAVRQRQAVRVDDVDQDPDFLGCVPGIRSEMVAPLVVDDRVLGVASVESTRLNAFSEADLMLLQTLAGQLATLFEKARLDAALAAERNILAERVAERTADLTAANAALARASRLKDEFLANMSHELRTPLTAVLALSEALQKQVYGPLTEKQVRSLHTIHESGEHLLSLINDILDLSKIEAGKLELQMDTVSADHICQASLRMIKQMAANKRQQVSYTSFAPGLVLRGDGRRLTQALVNLLGNAVKFTPVEGELGLEVQADAAEQAVRFTVWDRGIGMAAETLAQLFQPFVQLDAGLSRQHGGTGLGLALVRRLVEMHGGGVQVESQVGAGSRFTVSLPWQFVDGKTMEGREDERQETWQQPAARAEGEPRGVTVLVVEDTEATLRVLADYLDALGYRVLAARSGAEALRSVRAEPPDLILLDIQMPVMDGLEVMRRLRGDPNPLVACAPIVALTALVMPGDRQRCLQAGANEYLAKPVALDQLVATIERLARRPSAA